MIKLSIIIVITVLFSCTSRPNKQTKLLAGKWKVIASNVLPFEHISYCKKLGLGALFIFDEKGQLKVFTSNTAKENCNSSQIFSADSSEIVFGEGDMVFSYSLLKLTNDSLIFRNPHTPQYLFLGAVQTKTEDSIINLISKEGVIVKLVKLNE